MADKVDLCAVGVAVLIIMRHELRTLDDFVDEAFEMLVSQTQRLPPVISKWIHGHGLVGVQREFVAQLFDEFRVHDAPNTVGPNDGRLPRLIADIVGMQINALVLLAEQRPDALRFSRIFVAKVGGSDAGDNNDGIGK